LSKFIQDKKEKEKVIGLLKKAEISFFNVLQLEEKSEKGSNENVS